MLITSPKKWWHLGPAHCKSICHTSTKSSEPTGVPKIFRRLRGLHLAPGQKPQSRPHSHAWVRFSCCPHCVANAIHSCPCREGKLEWHKLLENTRRGRFASIQRKASHPMSTPVEAELEDWGHSPQLFLRSSAPRMLQRVLITRYHWSSCQLLSCS